MGIARIRHLENSGDLQKKLICLVLGFTQPTLLGFTQPTLLGFTQPTLLGFTQPTPTPNLLCWVSPNLLLHPTYSYTQPTINY
ncbi:hypothetical protein SPLC1_S031200 [Arthrospira platensis C1]|nr:hypothetical protein SPLC1_S031200 [Arthrospira platensis C1]